MEQPFIIIIAGPNGVGKSTFARFYLELIPECVESWIQMQLHEGSRMYLKTNVQFVLDASQLKEFVCSLGFDSRLRSNQHCQVRLLLRHY